MARVDQRGDDVAADEAGGAGDEDRGHADRAPDGPATRVKNRLLQKNMILAGITMAASRRPAAVATIAA